MSGVIAVISQKVFGSLTYTAQRGLHRGMKVHGGLGWLPSSELTEEDRFLSALDLAGKRVYDVGAFLGYKALYFARRAQHVLAYEPNPHTRERLMRNIELNALTNVTVRPVGLGSAPATVEARWDESRPGECSTVSGRGQHTCMFEVTTLDAEADAFGAPDLVKIDVEGLECEVIRGAFRMLESQRPDLFIEMHGWGFDDKMARVHEMFGLLSGFGYSMYDVEGKANITERPSVPIHHIYATVRK
jgi:FkbM family methyltransferase